MAQSLTLEEVLILTHQGETVETVKYFKCPDCSGCHQFGQCPFEEAEKIWLQEKDSIIDGVRKALSAGELEYAYEITDLDEKIVPYLTEHFEDEFESSGGQVSFVPQHCDECNAYILVDYQNLNPQKKAEQESKKDRNTAIILGVLVSGFVALVSLVSYFHPPHFF